MAYCFYDDIAAPHSDDAPPQPLDTVRYITGLGRLRAYYATLKIPQDKMPAASAETNYAYAATLAADDYAGEGGHEKVKIGLKSAAVLGQGSYRRNTSLHFIFFRSYISIDKILATSAARLWRDNGSSRRRLRRSRMTHVPIQQKWPLRWRRNEYHA